MLAKMSVSQKKSFWSKACLMSLVWATSFLELLWEEGPSMKAWNTGMHTILLGLSSCVQDHVLICAQNHICNESDERSWFVIRIYKQK